MEFDISKTVQEIVMQAKETQDEFIIETIYPYCEDVLQIKINKEELKQILIKGMAADKKPGKWKPRSIDGPGRSLMVYKCSECKKFALYMTDYCPSCGARMEWRRYNDK